jgi:hypothetical protein
MGQIERVVGAVAIGLLAGVGVTGCFTTTADYREQAESFILDDESIADGLGVAIVSVTCDEPTNQDVGTTFGCTAIDENDGEWAFEVEIEESNRIGVSVTERP